MTMHSKLDGFFIKIISVSIISVGGALFLPLLFIDTQGELSTVLTLAFIFLVFIGFILWVTLSIKYVFNKDYLFVKGGPFKSRIPYKDITRVSSTSEVFTGYRILSSRDAIEIFYKNAALGSVKVSPKNKSKFITELKKRNPELQTN